MTTKPDYPPSSLNRVPPSRQRGVGMDCFHTCTPLTGGFFVLKGQHAVAVDFFSNPFLLNLKRGIRSSFYLCFEEELP